MLGRQKRRPQAPGSAGFRFSCTIQIEILTSLWGNGSVLVGSQGLGGDFDRSRSSPEFPREPGWCRALLLSGPGWEGLGGSCRRGRAFVTTAAPDPQPCTGRKVGPSCPRREEEGEGCDTRHSSPSSRCSSPAIGTASTAKGSSRATKFPAGPHRLSQGTVLGQGLTLSRHIHEQERNAQPGHSSWCPRKLPGSSCPQAGATSPA